VRILLVSLLTALLPMAAATVDRGTIAVNRGAVGISLGMTRAAVIARLGKPIYKNANGYLQYSTKNIFDVYLDTSANRVRLVSVSGPRFCTPSGVCMMANGGIAKLRAQYGKRLKLVTAGDGEKLWVVQGRLGGRRVFTSFSPAPQGKIIQLFVGYCPPLPTPCGS
jgi:hypothetical protein